MRPSNAPVVPSSPYRRRHCNRQPLLRPSPTPRFLDFPHRHSLLLHRLRSLHALILTPASSPKTTSSTASSTSTPSTATSNTQLTHQRSRRHLSDAAPCPEVVARTSLINAHANADDILLARKVFDETPVVVRDTVFYNAMISGYSHAGEGLKGVRVFRSMLQDGFRPDDYSFTGVFSVAAFLDDLVLMQCQQLHCLLRTHWVNNWWEGLVKWGRNGSGIEMVFPSKYEALGSSYSLKQRTILGNFLPVFLTLLNLKTSQ